MATLTTASYPGAGNTGSIVHSINLDKFIPNL